MNKIYPFIFLISSIIINSACSNETESQIIIDNDEKSDSIVSDEGNDSIVSNETIKWQALPFSYVFLTENNDDNVFWFESNPTSIIKESPENIFIGNILLKNRYIIDERNYLSDVKYNKIIFGTIVGNRTYITEAEPSLTKTNELANCIIKDSPKQSTTSIFSSIPITYHSSKELNLISQGNIGIKLDSIIHDKAPAKTEFKTGLIYSFYNEYFSIDMDYPFPCLIQNALSDNEIKDLAYINSISYGKYGLIVFESEELENDIISAIKKYRHEMEINEKELHFLENANIHILYFDSERNIRCIKTDYKVTRQLSTIIDKLPIVQINFSVYNLSDNSETRLHYNIKL